MRRARSYEDFMVNKKNFDQSIQHRIIVVGIVRNDKGELLLCQMESDRGVFPGQWGFPGGGIEPGERMVDALKRELWEELGIEITDIRPGFFKDGLYEKLLPDGTKQMVYMIFLIFNCTAQNTEIDLNQEFSEYRWVMAKDAYNFDLNIETIYTLKHIGQ